MSDFLTESKVQTYLGVVHTQKRITAPSHLSHIYLCVYVCVGVGVGKGSKKIIE